MNISKFFSWALLVCGILVIAWTLYYSYGIFVGRNKIPEIFKLEVQRENISLQDPQASGLEKLQNQMQETVQKQLLKIIPENTIPKFLNLAAWGILAWIFIFGGFQVSSLGIKLMKK